jgi:hypothetical protein
METTEQATQHETGRGRSEVTVFYNGLERDIVFNAHAPVRVIVEQAIHAFGITQQPHLLSLFNEAGAELSDGLKAEDAGIKPADKLFLRPSAVKGG